MRRKSGPRVAEVLRVAKALMVAVMATVTLSMAASAAEIEDPFEQRFHEAAAAIHNKDARKAFGIWHELAQLGHADSQYAVGSLYGEGLGTKVNVKRTVQWWRRAAEQGHAGAQFNLGMLYDQGLGVRQNTDEAVRLWQSAANEGYADAMYRLGLSYQSGRGVPKDLRMAHTWFTAAVLKGRAAYTNEAEQAATALSPKELATSIDEATAKAARCTEHESSVPTTR